MSSQLKVGKGYLMEEALRYYFLELGYFVVRGVDFKYQGFDVTDIDLWLYMKASTVTRERINVDIKNRKAPQAIERIFWTKGLQEALGLEKCIVATTDQRHAIREFGYNNDVVILDGGFLTRIGKAGSHPDRVTEEEFFRIIDTDGMGRLKGDWKKRIESAKSILLTQLDYSGCNYWLKEISFYIQQALVDNQRREAACRAAYLMLSFFLIGLDFVFKDLSFYDSETRALHLKDGFLHGALGKSGTDKLLNTSMTLIENYLPQGKNLAFSLRRKLAEDYEQIPADILKEYFNKTEVARNLFQFARKFEYLAYSRIFTAPPDIETDLQAIVGVVLDFHEMERRQFYNIFREATEATSS